MIRRLTAPVPAKLTDDAARWMWFLQNAHKREGAEVATALGGAVFERAAAELESMSRDEAERQRAESRRRGLMAYNTDMAVSRPEGEAIGEERGEKRGVERGKTLGRVQWIRDLLERREPDDAALESMSIDDLAALEAELGTAFAATR